VKHISQKRTETIVETHEVWIIRRPGKIAQERCPICPVPALMFTPEDASRLSNMTPRMIYRLVEAGQTHFREIENGSLLICVASLPIAADATAAAATAPPSPLLLGTAEPIPSD
jgi:hypothetical protein